MQIISSAGEMRAMLPEVGVINSTGDRASCSHGRKGNIICCQSAGRPRQAGSTGIRLYTMVITASSLRVTPARLYIPMPGWYLASLYLKTATATAHDAALQIHNSYLASHIAYKKWNLPAASANYPNMLA